MTPEPRVTLQTIRNAVFQISGPPWNSRWVSQGSIVVALSYKTHKHHCGVTYWHWSLNQSGLRPSVKFNFFFIRLSLGSLLFSHQTPEQYKGKMMSILGNSPKGSWRSENWHWGYCSHQSLYWWTPVVSLWLPAYIQSSIFFLSLFC